MPPIAAETSVPTLSGLLALDAATDAGRCGHKAAALALLRNLGFDVPDGFVIPAGVQATRDEIAAALARLGDGPVAVRSSGLAEDLPGWPRFGCTRTFEVATIERDYPGEDIETPGFTGVAASRSKRKDSSAERACES